jgi:hypothetical protein
MTFLSGRMIWVRTPDVCLDDMSPHSRLRRSAEHDAPRESFDGSPVFFWNIRRDLLLDLLASQRVGCLCVTNPSHRNVVLAELDRDCVHLRPYASTVHDALCREFARAVLDWSALRRTMGSVLGKRADWSCGPSYILLALVPKPRLTDDVLERMWATLVRATRTCDPDVLLDHLDRSSRDDRFWFMRDDLVESGEQTRRLVWTEPHQPVLARLRVAFAHIPDMAYVLGIDHANTPETAVFEDELRAHGFASHEWTRSNGIRGVPIKYPTQWASAYRFNHPTVLVKRT